MRPLPIVVSLVLLFAVSPAAVFADPKAPAAAPSAASADVRDGGMIEGRVTGVDYQRGVVSVDTGRGAVDVSVMPSTSVQSSEPGYHALTDVAKGSRVQIFTSKMAGKFVAQIIRLLKH